MDATVTFKDGSTHIYRGVPDGTAPDVVEEQASKEFGKPVASLSGSSGQAAPAQSQPAPSIAARIKNAIIAPENERDPSLGTAIIEGIKGIPGAIAKEAKQGWTSASEGIEDAVGTPKGPMTAGDIIAGPYKPMAKIAGGALQTVLSPLTGTLNSALGRPVEQATGLRREVTGGIASAFVPLGSAEDVANAAKAVNAAKDVKGAGTVIKAAIKPMASEANAAGYVLPPKMISEKPGIVADVLSGMSGKIKTAQAAAEKNQVVTNGIAAKELGLPPDTQLSEQSFNDVRAQAGKSYEAVKTAIPSVTADKEYLDTVSQLGGSNSDAAQHFPNIMKNDGIKDLVDELTSVKDFPTSAGMELVKELRSSAVANLKAIGDRSAHALGLAQRQAADAVDGLIERNIAQSGGDPKLVQQYKDARQLIAKSYDVEGATNAATGDVNALGIARLASKGKPLSGGLATVAKVAQAFPQAMKAGVVSEPLSALDFFGAAALAAHGNPKLAGMMLARPVARATILSPTAQATLIRNASPAAEKAAKAASPIRRVPAVNALAQFTQQGQQP